jgi:hypothetical protein
MTERTINYHLTFAHPFLVDGDILPAGTYPIVAEEELIHGLSFEAWRRTLTYIVIDRPGHQQLRQVTQSDLDEASARDLGSQLLHGEAAPFPLEDVR